MIDIQLILSAAESKRAEQNTIIDATPKEVRRVEYIVSHLELMGLRHDVEVVKHINRALPDYLTSLGIAKEYGKYYQALTVRHRGEIEELIELLDK